MKRTPTTKILAIGTINPGFEQSQVFAVLPEEVRETVDLYLDGKIEQWYSRTCSRNLEICRALLGVMRGRLPAKA